MLLKLLFDKLLIGDDILEERLAKGAASADRLRHLEERIDQLDGELAALRDAAAAPRDPRP